MGLDNVGSKGFNYDNVALEGTIFAQANETGEIVDASLTAKIKKIAKGAFNVATFPVRLAGKVISGVVSVITGTAKALRHPILFVKSFVPYATGDFTDAVAEVKENLQTEKRAAANTVAQLAVNFVKGDGFGKIKAKRAEDAKFVNQAKAAITNLVESMKNNALGVAAASVGVSAVALVAAHAASPLAASFQAVEFLGNVV